MRLILKMISLTKIRTFPYLTSYSCLLKCTMCTMCQKCNVKIAKIINLNLSILQ